MTFLNRSLKIFGSQFFGTKSPIPFPYWTWALSLVALCKGLRVWSVLLINHKNSESICRSKVTGVAAGWILMVIGLMIGLTLLPKFLRPHMQGLPDIIVVAPAKENKTKTEEDSEDDEKEKDTEKEPDPERQIQSAAIEKETEQHI